MFSFDFGGLTGSLIGTLGAYFISWKTFKWYERQREPESLAMELAVADKFSGIITESMGVVIKSVNVPSIREVLNTVFNDIIAPLNDLSFEAAKFPHLYRLIREARSDILSEWTKFVPEDVMSADQWESSVKVGMLVGSVHHFNERWSDRSTDLRLEYEEKIAQKAKS